MIASERIKMDPFKVLVGDLVLAEERDIEADAGKFPVPQRGAILIVLLAPSSYRGNPDRSWTTASSVKVKVLTAEDLDNYTLADVVLPLPGFDIKYPEGPLYEKYKEIMAADGLDPAKMRRDQR
jgi:tRNA pseudouridine13 synthase